MVFWWENSRTSELIDNPVGPFRSAVGRFCFSLRGLDREAAIAKVVEKAGGKVIGYYMMFGEDDWLLIIDCPNNETALSIAIVAAAGGSIADTKTSVAMTSKQAMAAFKAAGELAKSFKNPGR